MNKHLLETDQYFHFLTTENRKGIDFEVYIDDFGQSYCLAWISPKTNELKKWCCGTYNDYQYDMEDIADYESGVNIVNEPICPRCGSMRTRAKDDDVYVCRDCEHQWSK